MDSRDPKSTTFSLTLPQDLIPLVCAKLVSIGALKTLSTILRCSRSSYVSIVPLLYRDLPITPLSSELLFEDWSNDVTEESTPWWNADCSGARRRRNLRHVLTLRVGHLSPSPRSFFEQLSSFEWKARLAWQTERRGLLPNLKTLILPQEIYACIDMMGLHHKNSLGHHALFQGLSWAASIRMVHIAAPCWARQRSATTGGRPVWDPDQVRLMEGLASIVGAFPGIRDVRMEGVSKEYRSVLYGIIEDVPIIFTDEVM